MNEPEQTNFHASLLFQLVEDFKTPFTCERSMRLCRKGLFANRFLLTIAKNQLSVHAAEKTLQLCRRLGMAETDCEQVSAQLPTAKFVHFGFEENDATCLYKVYLEFATIREDLPATVLLYLAFKWDIADSSQHVCTKYIWRPGLSAEQIESRFANIYCDPSTAASFDIAKEILAVASSRHAVKYLEVGEGASKRRSFDINLYDCKLQVSDLERPLLRMAEHFGLASDPFREVYEEIKDKPFGHLAGGIHRRGEDFFNLYYGAQRRSPRGPARTVWDRGDMKRLQHTAEQDQYYNYCWWPYLPVAPVENKLRSVNLLFHSFETAGLGTPIFHLVEAIRNAIGPFRTVWGVKLLGDRLAWEFYFYDYQRRQRQISMTRVLDALRPQVLCDVPINESLPYFMFSLDIDGDLAAGARPIDVIHMYVGNPGSKVSSGIAYAVTAAGTALENFYFFFDAKRDLRDAAEKICCSAYVDGAAVDIDRILRPEWRTCNTICVANKRHNDTVYFSGVNVQQLLSFLKTLQYPAALVDFALANQDKLDHLLYDVGFDYVTNEGEIQVVKSGFYGIF